MPCPCGFAGRVTHQGYTSADHNLGVVRLVLRPPKEIKKATMHSTNKAFERYFRIESEDPWDIYRDTLFREKRQRKVKNRTRVD
jgi:hypothetical protein